MSEDVEDVDAGEEAGGLEPEVDAEVNALLDESVSETFAREEEAEAEAPPVEEGEAEVEAEVAAELAAAEEAADTPAAPPQPPRELLEISNAPREIVLVPDDQRITSNILTKTEMALVIATRAEQLSKHFIPFVDWTGLTDAEEIARKEFHGRRCPLVVRREVGTGPNGELIVEDWKVREMVYL